MSLLQLANGVREMKWKDARKRHMTRSMNTEKTRHRKRSGAEGEHVVDEEGYGEEEGAVVGGEG